MSPRAGIAVLALIVACACGREDPETACTAELRFGLNVIVVNGQTQQRICDAVVTARDGDYQETLELLPGASPSSCQHIGAPERAGSYQLTAARSGFAPAAPVTAVVTEDACHVQPVSLSLTLQPL